VPVGVGEGDGGLGDLKGREGRRDGGTEGRRDGGTEGRRDGGTEGRREGGTEGSGVSLFLVAW
jgi:hypothetical protein